MTQIVTSPSDGESIGSATAPPPVRWGRLLIVALCLVCVGAGGVYWWVFAGGEHWWHNAFLPPMASFRGKVLLDGEPLRGGQLKTWPDRAGVPRSVGFIDQDGEFNLRTDVNGTYIDQAFVGRHRVTVEQFSLQRGPSAPRMTSPAKYARPETSGLQLTVDPDSSKNFALFALVSESTESAAPQPSAVSGPPSRQTPATRETSNSE